MNISPTTLALIVVGAGFLGAIVPSFLALRIARLTKESEERKHQKELIVNTALESRRQQIELAKLSPAPKPLVLPLEDHVLYIVTLSKIIFEKNLDEATLSARMEELREFSAQLRSERERIIDTQQDS